MRVYFLHSTEVKVKMVQIEPEKSSFIALESRKATLVLIAFKLLS